jgi:hypothetical protein
MHQKPQYIRRLYPRHPRACEKGGPRRRLQHFTHWHFVQKLDAVSGSSSRHATVVPPIEATICCGLWAIRLANENQIEVLSLLAHRHDPMLASLQS